MRVTGSKSSFFAVYVAKVAVKNCSGKLQFCMGLGHNHSLGHNLVTHVKLVSAPIRAMSPTAPSDQDPDALTMEVATVS